MSSAVPSLYVHTPFCPTKCGYCDFYSLAGRESQAGPLTDALLRELDIRLNDWRAAWTTVFVGGGTPTRLPISDLRRILERIVAATSEPIAEFTVESNPETLDAANAAMMRSLGVNRISIGAQSFHKDELAVLERVHEPASVGRSVAIARSAGFERINLDLIFGVPGQTVSRWLESLERAVDLGPTHIACYGLTYEPQTALTAHRDAGRLTPIDEQVEADMFAATIDTLTAAGFEHYEISNYAKAGDRCEHNLRYWRNEPYLGVGPSAASFLGGRRWRNAPHLERYLDAVGRGCLEDVEIDVESLDATGRMRESIMLGLRLRDGVDLARLKATIGIDAAAAFRTTIDRYVADGLLEIANDRLCLSARGLLVGDDVMGEFLVCDLDTPPETHPPVQSSKP